MAAEEEKNNDFYAVLGLKKECTAAELKNAYKKLALKWHPDRCSASGNAKFVDEANKKFQAIQEAYSVLSDANKRFLYDVGVYESGDDDDESGMCDFLNEMATMMSQNKSNESQGESFEELQELFEEMFQTDIGAFGSSSSSRTGTPSVCSSSSSSSFSETFSTFSNKRSSAEMRSDRWNIWKIPRKGKESEKKHRERTEALEGTPKGKSFYQGMMSDSTIIHYSYVAHQARS